MYKTKHENQKKSLSNFGLRNYKTYKNSIATSKSIWLHCGCHINRSLVDIWRPTDNKCIGFQQVILFNFSTIVDFPINWSSGGIFSFQIDMNVIECEFKKNCYTLYNVLLRIARKLLETRENIKILTHPVYHTNLDRFSWEWSKKKKNFFEEKKFKMADFSKWPFFKIANSRKNFAKISLIGPWVSRIDWCKGHRCSST